MGIEQRAWWPLLPVVCLGVLLPACRGREPQTGVSSSSSAAANGSSQKASQALTSNDIASFWVEYRFVTRFPTCLNNRRIRVHKGGKLYQARNTTDCVRRGQRWSTPYPKQPLQVLSEGELRDLIEEIRGSGFFGLKPRYERQVMDGYLEEIEVHLRGRKHTVTVINTTRPDAFQEVRDELMRLTR